MSVLLIQQGDARFIPLASESVHCCVTSPPYWGLRDYGVAGQIGLERTPEEYISAMVKVFWGVWRVLRDDGTLWLNIGDTYSGSWARSSNPGGKLNSPMQQSNQGSYVGDHAAEIVPPGCKPKDLIGIPWMLAFALRAGGWYLRSDIIWSKPNPMPESVTDRPTKSHEYIFLLSKSERYYYDQDAIREPWLESSLERLKTGWDGNKKRDWPGSGQNNFDRYMGKTEDEIANLPGRNKRSVWRADEHRSAHMEDTPRNDGARWRIADGGVAPRGDGNRRSVWEIATQPFAEAHFATFPEELIKPCILAGCPAGGIVLDPFAGSGTTALVARNLQCHAIGIEMNPAYLEIAKKRLAQGVLTF
jgi:DNA modification methylase